jgi:hypothetical protein
MLIFGNLGFILKFIYFLNRDILFERNFSLKTFYLYSNKKFFL